jgi:hypothetical protein
MGPKCRQCKSSAIINFLFHCLPLARFIIFPPKKICVMSTTHIGPVIMHVPGTDMDISIHCMPKMCIITGPNVSAISP